MPAPRGFFPTRMESDWFKPTLDVAADDQAYTITVELPGVDKKDVRVEVSGDALVIRGDKKREHEEKGKDYHRVERSYGTFQRTLALPDDADPDGIEAAFKDGLMTVTVPRRAAAETSTKQIEVQAA
jgi:HSP20 family protein